MLFRSPMLMGSLLLVGVGSVIAYTGLLAAAGEIAGVDRRGAAIGTVYSGSAAGSAVGPLVGSLATEFGRAPVFGMVAIGQALVAALLSRLPNVPNADAAPMMARVTRRVQSDPGATVFGYGHQTSPELAALANSMMVRAYDYNDAYFGHPSDMIPGVLTVEKHRSQAARAYANWEAVLDGLRRELDALAREFVRGEARVSPKHGAASCRLCELHGLCRISEREGRSPQDDDEASADFGESA